MPQTLTPPVEDGPWAKGVDSYLEPTQVQKSFYRTGINISNRGGIVRTRPGFSIIRVTANGGQTLIGQPRGLTVFTDGDNNTFLVIAIGPSIYYLKAPFTGDWTRISNLSFTGQGPVCFVRCVQSVTEADDGTLTDIDPIPMIIIQDGVSRAAYWDGKNSRHLDPAKKDPYKGPSETPIGLWGEWSGNRYWVANGSRIRASNLLNPLKFTEEDLLEEGGFLQFPNTITGVSNTADFRAMLVFTDLTTSTLQTSITDRTQWAITAGFQVVVFYGIGCVGGNAIATQWGLKWWYSHDGLMSLDEGLRAYQSSKVTYRDREMAASKENIANDFKDNIAMGADENLLFVSVPSGDRYNAHTWVMDEAPLDTLTYWGYFGLPSWSGIWEGIRPVAWFTAPVDGVHRTFCLSQDYPFGSDPNVTPMQNNVWECVVGARMDRTIDSQNRIITKPILCQLETKLIGYDGNYKFFRFAEIYIDNIEGEVFLEVFYAPRRGGYKRVLHKQIVSSDWDLVNLETYHMPWLCQSANDFLFYATRPQARVVRTISEAKSYTTPNSGDDVYQSVQTSANVPFPRQKDYAFSLLLQWTGRMSVSSVRMYFDAEEQEVEGIAEVDETTDRFLIMNGACIVAAPPKHDYLIDPNSFDFNSNTMTGAFPIWIDPIYQTMK